MGLLDGAYLEYLMAFSIVATVIPACQEYPTFRFVIGSKHLRNYETLKTACLLQYAAFCRRANRFRL